ncbi:hypothetical protein [Halorarius halobius]|uniref:hypothetical protein n=1 Tax=Halorarius halobius TaxID=2962671 RepID=UPI0020CD8F77|nr:hypothetical protein [Halorarius halobius]
MEQSLPEEWFIKDARVNAAIAWLLTGLLAATAVVYFLLGSLVVVAIAAVATTVAVVPAVVHRSWTRTVPWPMLLLAVVALLAGAFGPSFLGDVVFALAVAALAILVVVTLQLTTTVRMTPNFAIGFVVIATLATAGLWALGSAASARYLGTEFVETNDQLMLVFTAALAASVVSALLFRWYFARRLEANLEREEVRGA